MSYPGSTRNLDSDAYWVTEDWNLETVPVRHIFNDNGERKQLTLNPPFSGCIQYGEENTVVVSLGLWVRKTVPSMWVGPLPAYVVRGLLGWQVACLGWTCARLHGNLEDLQEDPLTLI